MKTLNALTDQIQSLSTIAQKQAGTVIYALEKGTAITMTLKENKDVHIIDSFLSAGTEFPFHQHELSFETLILESGAITVTCKDPGCQNGEMKHKLEIGVPFGVPQEINHSLIAHEDSWILATLIPPDKEMIK